MLWVLGLSKARFGLFAAVFLYHLVSCSLMCLSGLARTKKL